MTHQLKRLMDGKLSSRHSNGPDAETHFIGMVWKPPYTLLRELVNERCALTNKLIKLDGHQGLEIAEPPAVPTKVSHDTITRMVREELKLYNKLRQQIKTHEKKI